MALLFYGGIMNLKWIIGLALFVLLEKVVPAGHWVGRFSGIALIIWGTTILSLLSLGVFQQNRPQADLAVEPAENGPFDNR